MIRIRYLIVLALLGIMVSGCPKSDQQGAAQSPATPPVQKNPVAAKAEEAFNKFFSGNKDSAAAAAKSGATFSMHKPEAPSVKVAEAGGAAPAPASVSAPAPAPETKPASAVAMPAAKTSAAAPRAAAAPKEKTVPIAKTASPVPAQGAFAVQVMSTPSSGEADAAVAKFKAMGYPAIIQEAHNPRPDLEGTYYRVRIAGFATAADAKSFGETVVHPAHLDYWVVHTAGETGATTPAIPSAPARHRTRMIPTEEAAHAPELHSHAGIPHKIVAEPNIPPAPSPVAVKVPDPAKSPAVTASPRVAAPAAAGSSDGYPTFDQLMKAIDEDSHKAGAPAKSAQLPDSAAGKK